MLSTLIGALLLTVSHAQTSAEPALDPALLESIRLSVATEDPATRQATLVSLLAWTKTNLKLNIDWSRLASLEYDGSDRGSKTDSKDPLKIAVTFGWNAFNCEGDVTSTFRHELVHVAQHQDQARAIRRGWGIQEIEAYLWELDHAHETGLELCDRKTPEGEPDTFYGVTRAADGVFRYLSVLETELAAGTADISAAELAEVNTHISCSLRAHAAIVTAIYPTLDWSELPPCP